MLHLSSQPLSRRTRIMNSLMLGFAGLSISVGVLAGAGALSTQSAAAETKCGGVDTSIISGTVCDGVSSDAANTDSSKNPIIAVITFVLQVLTGAVGVAAVGAIIYGAILYSSAGGNSGQVEKAKTTITNTVIGIVCYAGMILILNFIIPGGVFGQQGVNGSGTANTGGGGTSGGATTPGSGSNAKELESFTVATWNTRGDNPTNIGTSAKKIDADIIGFQEVHQSNHRSQLSSISCSGCSYAMQSGGSGSKGSDPIIWRRSMFTKTDDGVSYMSSPAGYTVRYATWIKLKDKKTNKEFFVINTHTPPGVEKGSGWSARTSMTSAYKTHLKNLAHLVANKKATGLPVFVTGDFNVDYRNDGKDCKIANWACRMLGKPYGIYPAWHYTDLAGVNKSQGTFRDGDRLIDYVMFPTRNDIKVKSTKVLGGNGNGWSGSDHKPSIATAAFAQ